MLTQRFMAKISEQDLFPGEALILLGVSGGLDSIVLMELCKQAGFRF